MTLLFSTVMKQSPDTGPGNSPHGDPDTKILEQEKEQTQVLCRYCRSFVTDQEKQISVNDAHHHVFANPHGLIFDILCYSRAQGCLVLPESSSEFTWFAGYRWHAVLCRSCSNHLGWFFLSGSDSFFGLIEEHLIIP
ncbi:MAG: cereblon family protein [Pseudomonadota bacterium]